MTLDERFKQNNEKLEKGESKGLSLKDRFDVEAFSASDYANDYLSQAADSDMLAKYASVMQNADFAENSQYKGGSGFHLTNQAAHGAYENLNSGNNKDPRNLSWTPNEKAVFNYLYNTEDYKTATQLLLDLTNDSNVRYNEIEKAEAQKRIDNYGNLVGESALSVPKSVIGGLGQIAGGLSMGLTSALQGEGFSKGWTEAAEMNRLSNAANAVRESSTEKIAQDSGNNVAPFFYQTGMSVGDSLFSMLISGGVGELGALLALGGSASQQKTMEVLNNGGTAQEAAISGITSGVIEGLTEKISLGHLTKILKGNAVKGGFRELAKTLAKNMLEEAGEEATSELTNALTDAIILDWTNNVGTESDLKKFYDEQIANGYSESVATENTIKELAKNTLVSAAGGALGALMSGGVTTGIRTASDYRAGKTTNEYGRTQDIADLARKEGREDIAQMIEKNPSNLNVGYAQDTLTESAIETLRNREASAEDKIRSLERLGELKEKSSPITGITDKNGKMLHPTAIKWEEGTPVFVTEEGTYKAADVTVTDSASKLINLTEDIPEQARQTFIENYNGENLGDYVNKFEQAYELAKADWQDDLTKMVTDGLLTETQMKNIYAVAQKDVTSESYQLESLKKNIEEKKKLFPDKKIRVKIDTSAVDLTKLNANQRHNVTLAEAFAKALGFNLTLFDSTKEQGQRKNINGSYEESTNTISLDINATNTGTHNKGTTNAIITTLSHEITHWSKTNAPGIYKAFRDTTLKALNENSEQNFSTIGEYVDVNKAAYPGLSDAEVADELVARACENMLQNSEFAKEALGRMTAEEQKTLGEKIIEFFNKIREAIKEIMGRSDSNSLEYRMLKKDADRLVELQKMWDNLIKEASANAPWANADISEAVQDGVLLNGSEENNFMFSEKTYNEGGREFLQRWLNEQKDLTKNEKKAILDSMEQVYETVQKLKEGYQSYSNWAEAGAELRGEDGEISVVVNNGEYALNIDFTTVCKKREVLNRVLNELVKSGDLNIYTLTKTDVNKINQIIKENGFEIACALCFVDAKRYKVGEWARSFEETYNDIIYQLAGANGKTADEFNYTNRVLDNPTEALISDAENVNLSVLDQIIKENTGKKNKLNAKGTLAKAIKENKSLWHKINASEIISSVGLDEIRMKNKELYKLVNGWEGSAKPKLSHGKVPYQNDILQNGKFNSESAFKVGGVRIQSFSDFVPTMIFDYVQMVSELQAKGLPAHAYTKELTFAKLFGLTGIKINLSAIAKGKPIKAEWYDSKGNIKKEYRDLYARANAYVGLKTNEEVYPVDANGNVITTNLNLTADELKRAVYETDDESIDLEEAIKLQNTPGYDKNVGIIFVGASNNAIRKMLDDPDIPMIIPYHKSGINPVVAHLRNIASYTDYTNMQNTMFADGKKIERKDLKGKDKGYYDSLDWYTLLGKNKGDAKKAAAEYVRLCEKKGWRPKFDEFKNHPNYYKLLEDFRMYDSNGVASPQTAVKLTNGLDQNGKAVLNMPTNEEFIKALEGDEKTGGLKKYDKSVSDLENGKLDKILKEVRTELQKVQNSVKEDSEGRRLTDEQAEFFKNSVVRDSKGRVKRVYHGTTHSGFTIFEQTDDGLSFFFTDSTKTAFSYSGTTNIANPDYPMDFDMLKEGFEFYNHSFEKDGNYFVASNGEEEHRFKTLKEAQAWFYDNIYSLAVAQGEFSPANYEVYLNIQNPLVIDGRGRAWSELAPDTWAKKYADVNITKNGDTYEAEWNTDSGYKHKTFNSSDELSEAFGGFSENEWIDLEYDSLYFEELYLDKAGKKIPTNTREWAKYAHENGYDGVIFNNIVDNGAYELEDLSPSTVYVVFNSNQAKSIYNEHPTGNLDIRYSRKEDSEGKELSQDQIEFFARSQARDENGRLKVLFHGTKEFGFTTFDTEKSDDKLSFFFTDSKDIAKSYANYGMLILPTSDQVVDVTKNTSLPDREAKNFKTVQEAQDYLNSIGIKVDARIEKSYGREKEYFSFINPSLGRRTTFGRTGFLEYASDIRRVGINPRAIYKVYLNLVNPLVVKASGNNWHDLAYSRMDVTKNPIAWEGKDTREITKWASESGFDGVIFEDIVDAGSGAETRPELRKTSNVYVAFDSNQVKSVGNLHPTKNLDIRYSLKEDSEGKELSKDQIDFFKNSMVRTADGRLKVMYHGARGAGFTVFNQEMTDDGLSFFFTDKLHIAKGYTGSKEVFSPDKKMTFEELKQLAENYLNGEWYIEKDGPSVVVKEVGLIGEEDNTLFEGKLKDAQKFVVDRLNEGSGVDANYKAYLNLVNPLVVNAEGNQWDELPLLEGMESDSGFATTRDYSRYASENGYDGVIFNNIYDVGLYSTTSEAETSTVAVAFSSEQIKSVDNLHPTQDKDIRYSRKYDVEEISEDMYKEMAEHFGMTTNYNVAGYMLQNGKMLDFSGRHWGDTTSKSRQVDHREIAEVLPSKDNGFDAMVNMISNGNIRLMPEVGGINLSIMPTDEQFEELKKYIRYHLTHGDREVTVDFDEVGGDTVYSRHFDSKANPEHILIEIANYFRNGARVSDLMDFHTGYMYSKKVDDDETLDFLNKQKTVKTYRSMQLIDGKLYSPMAAKVNGKFEDPSVLGQWEMAVEHPELVTANGKFKLDKGGKKSDPGMTDVMAAYNPYMHSSDLPINDQFSGAYGRPNLVTVECEVPVSELTSGYHADKAKDSVGWHDWHTGPVATQLTKTKGIRRRVLLSRWLKPVRILSDAEVAQRYKELLSDTDIEVPENVVTPSLLNELEKVNVPIKRTLSGEVFSYKDNEGYLHLDADDILSLDDFENYLNRVIGRNKRIEAHLRRLNVKIKDNVILNNTKLYQFAKTIKEQYNVNETIKSIAEELSKAYLKVTDIEAFDKAAESAAKKYAKTEEDVKTLISDIREASWRISDNLTMAEKYDEAMKELRERLKNAKEEVREDAQRKRLIQKIVEREDRLITMLRKNDKENHIPDVLKAPLKALLDLVDVQAYVTTEAMANNFNALANALQNVSADYADPEAMDNALKDLTLYFDSNGYFVQNVKDIAAEVQAKVGNALGTTKHNSSILDLSMDSLKKLNEALVAISHAAWNYDKVLAEDTTQRISTRSESTMAFLGQFDKRKAKSDVMKRAISFLAWDNTTPIYGYDRFGNGGKETFRGIMKGDDQLTLNSKVIIDFTKSVFTGQEAENWSKEIHDLGIGDYKITTAQIMSLYCLNKRQAAKQHLYAARDLYGKRLEGAVKNVYGEVMDGKGIVIGETKGIEKSKAIQVTKADVERITSMLTDRQKEVADKLQEFMGTVCADWGNYVTMRRFGIMQFGEDNYFPMQVFLENRESHPKETVQQASIFKLLNMGFTKSLNERGNGALELNSIFDVFIRHSSEMAAYNAFALPILDAYKWLSYKEEGTDGIKSLKTASRLAYGNDGINFIMNHLEDLNGTSNTATSAEQIVKNVIRRYKTAATAANMRVVLMQPTSYLRAVNEIDSKYLRRAINLNPKALKATIDEMNEKSPLAMKKNGLGAFDVNVSRTVAEQALQTENVKSAKGAFEKAMNISMIAASKADEITWATLYKAAQLETKEKHPELTGDAFDSLVNDRFRDICYRTQVFDSINARSNLMRKKDLFHQMLTAFGSEPTLSYSMLSNNVFLYAVEARNGQYQRAWNKYGKKIKHAFVAFMLSAIAVSAVAAVPDWLRDDEDDKNFIETYFKNFGMNILGEATGLLPYFRDIYSVFIEGYDPSRPDEEIFKTARQAGSALTKAVEDGQITYRTVYQAAKLFSQSTGLPIGNLVRDFKSLWNKTVGEVFGMKIK